jgi:salicylate hydroxylase
MAGMAALASVNFKLCQRIQEGGSTLTRIKLMRGHGEVLFDEAVSMDPVLITWYTLQSELLAALPKRGVDIRLNHRVTGFSYLADDLVELAVVSGGTGSEEPSTSAIRCQVLVGCDGASSGVRQAILGDGPPEYVGSISVRGLVLRSALPSGLLDGGDTMLMAAGGGLNFWVMPCGAVHIAWAASYPQETPHLGHSKQDSLAHVQTMFSAFPQLCLAVLALTDPASVVELPTCHRPPITTWTDGKKATLLGDGAVAVSSLECAL